MRNKWILHVIAFVLLLSAIGHAQVVGNINGKVIDARTKEPLIGVNVLVLGTDRGAATDFEGNYKIENIPVGTYRLRFDYIGFESLSKTDVVVISARHTVINVQLKESIIEGQEVTVTAGYFIEEKNVQPSTLGLSREEIRRFPGGFEDVVRTVSTLPGVAINSGGGRNDLLVRGGGPSENLYIINNIEVPNINHFGTQGNSSGSLSFVNLDFVEDVSFSTGGFGARYGDKMSAVLGLTMKQDIPEHFESKWTVSATQFGFNFDSPIQDKGNFIFSARKSYLDLIFKAAGLPFVPIYTDFNIITSYELSPKDKLFFLGLSAINNVDRDMSSLENRVTNAGLLDNTQYQGIAGINYRRLLSSGYLDLTLSNNLFRYRLSQLDENEKEYFDSEADERETYLKAQHYWVASKSFGLRSGVSAKLISNNNTTTFADTIYDRSGNRVPVTFLGVENVTKVDALAKKYAAFMEMDWTVHPSLELNAGLRSDYYGFINDRLYIAPRMALKYKLTNKHNLRLSGGVYYQAPSYVWVVNTFNKNLKALQNRMGVIGWDYLIRDDVRFAVETYYKRYSDLPTGIVPGRTDYIVINNTGTGFGGREDDFQSFGYFDLVSKGKGKAYGLDLLLQKKYSDIPLYGQASLSYGKSEFVPLNGRTSPGQYDQRWIFNLSGGYIFNSKWEVAAKFRYFTGVPITPVYRPSENPVNPGSIQNLPDEYLTGRLDPGHHLDVRVDRFWNFPGWTLITYVDIQNIYNNKIPQRPSYDFWADQIITSSSIGVLPSIGVSVEF
ncbi:TonB-dependent receptor [candidate division KSB1 bacterium]|nr:TonB-dependent receptor [candidate division KSB1 bacterium]